MDGELARQALLMLGEGVLIVVVLLPLFRLRGLLGLAPVYVAAAVLYQLANLTAGSVYIRVSPDLAMSPGSVVIFPAILVVVLFVYIREDADEARKLIYGLLAGDVLVAALGVLIAQHFQSPLMANPLGLTPALFLEQPRILIVGTLALYADTVLIILVYELVSRLPMRALYPRLALAMVTVLLFDTALFVTGNFVETPAYTSILLSDSLGKTIAGLLYAAFLAVYLRSLEPAPRTGGAPRLSLGDLFEHLTYRQRYEALRSEMTRDRLTGVFNRAFLDDMCVLLEADSKRSGRRVTLLMIDVDHFKQINDTFGHRVGDSVLQAVAGSIRGTCRPSDLVCRYGGEEFVVLLPGTELADGLTLAARIGPAVTTMLAQGDARWAARPITVTIGLALFPTEASTMEQALRVADQRMYEGKAAGRNRIMPAAPPGEPQVQSEKIMLHRDAR